MARGADDVHALGFDEVAVLVGEHEQLAAVCAHFLHGGFGHPDHFPAEYVDENPIQCRRPQARVLYINKDGLA